MMVNILCLEVIAMKIIALCILPDLVAEFGR